METNTAQLERVFEAMKPSQRYYWRNREKILARNVEYYYSKREDILEKRKVRKAYAREPKLDVSGVPIFSAPNNDKP